MSGRNLVRIPCLQRLGLQRGLCVPGSREEVTFPPTRAPSGLSQMAYHGHCLASELGPGSARPIFPRRVCTYSVVKVTFALSGVHIYVVEVE